MNTGTRPARSRPATEPDHEPTSPASPGDRGQTHYQDRVVEKIAAQAVEEVAAARGAGRRLLGVALGHDAGQQPARVSAEVDGDIVTVAVRLGLAYPAPIRATTREVRAHVIARVGQLTGLTVKEVDIEVVALTTTDSQARRVR